MSEAKRRQAICLGCDKRVPTILAGFICNVCKCNIRAKSYIAIAECPLGKWELEND
tara:strand:+ start:150 stop:317 length:168 start_codon:yes stop_codon:yes gene_type:complete